MTTPDELKDCMSRLVHETRPDGKTPIPFFCIVAYNDEQVMAYAQLLPSQEVMTTLPFRLTVRMLLKGNRAEPQDLALILYALNGSRASGRAWAGGKKIVIQGSGFVEDETYTQRVTRVRNMLLDLDPQVPFVAMSEYVKEDGGRGVILVGQEGSTGNPTIGIAYQLFCFYGPETFDGDVETQLEMLRPYIDAKLSTQEEKTFWHNTLDWMATQREEQELNSLFQDPDGTEMTVAE